MEGWLQILLWALLTPFIVAGVILALCLFCCLYVCAHSKGSSCKGWNCGRGTSCSCCCCCCREEKVHVAPSPQYPYPGYTPGRPYPVQYAPVYFYPQGYAPPPPPQVVIDERLTTIFRKLDKDNSGGIDVNEATIGAKEFGALGYFLASDEQVKAFFTAADRNRDGKIDFNEFVNITKTISTNHPHPQPPQVPPPPRYAPVIDERLTTIFRKLDKDNSGGIDVNEAMVGAKEFGALGYFLASDEEVKAFFAAADRNKDSKIDFGEFSSIAGALAAKHPHPQPPEAPSSSGEQLNQTGRETNFPVSVVSVMGQPGNMSEQTKEVRIDL